MNENPIVIFPAEILAVKPGSYEGHDYTTLSVRSGENIAKVSGKGGFDFAPFKDAGIVKIQVELREKNGYYAPRAVGILK